VLKVEESQKFWCLGLNLLQGDRAWSGKSKVGIAPRSLSGPGLDNDNSLNRLLF
jgi:hypothetical protein